MLIHSCVPVSYTHDRKTDREISRILSGEEEVKRMSSPGEGHTLFYAETSDHTDPSTVFITFVVVQNDTKEIGYHDRIRGIDIQWIGENTLSILAPIGILNEQSTNTRRYLIDVQNGAKVLSEDKEEL